MKTKYAVLSSLFFIIQLVGVLPLRAEHYYFKQISLKEGLPSNVRCILRDEQGFVWIGTKSGLGKFDGHELKDTNTRQTTRTRFSTTWFIKLPKTSNTTSGY